MRKHLKPIAILLSILITVMMLPMTAASAAETDAVQTAADELLLGDADLDGEITILDATVIQRFLVGIVEMSDEAQLAADVDGDGEPTILDATLIQRWLVGITVNCDVGEPITSEVTPTEAETVAPTEAELTGDEWKENTGTIVLSDSGITVTGNGAYVVGNIVFITEGGDWEVTGTCSDGMIYVYTGDEKDINDKVKLRLNGMSLTNTSGPAIYFDRDKKSFITLESGTTNTLVDGATYAAATDYTVNGVTYTVDCSAAKGTLNSDDTLEIKGKGTLNVTGNYKHGISSSDDISIENGVFNITTTAKDAIHANDDITVNGKNVEITINSASDGIDSEGTLNLTLLKTANITAVGKAIKADLDIVIDAGTYTLNTTDDCINGNAAVNLTGGTYDLTSGDEAVTAASTLTTENIDLTANTTGKGIKAESDLYVNSGTYTINSGDDSVHCNGNVTIYGGEFNISSGDDGMHADTTLTIEDGTIIITKSYEGLEGNDVIINGGVISVVASDDGINAAGGQDSSSQGGRPGQNPFQPGSSSNNAITVNGGEVYVVSSGDGVDSNGALNFNGGIVVVQGPNSGGNFAVDADGTVGFNGGTVAALCSASAMWEDITSKTGNAVYNKSIGSVTKGSTVCVTDSSGSVLAAVKSQLSGSLGILFYSDSTSSLSNVKFVTGGTYSGTLNSYGYGTGGTVSGGTSCSPSTSSGGGNQPGGPGGRW
ncbi:MAG: carbohydrate-binding domain-containing protein [Ruminococcus sp.]|nr:carbohydrate-binding domain-containing protein [Ruminococcus sp.]